MTQGRAHGVPCRGRHECRRYRPGRRPQWSPSAAAGLSRSGRTRSAARSTAHAVNERGRGPGPPPLVVRRRTPSRCARAARCEASFGQCGGRARASRAATYTRANRLKTGRMGVSSRDAIGGLGQGWSTRDGGANGFSAGEGPHRGRPGSLSHRAARPPQGGRLRRRRLRRRSRGHPAGARVRPAGRGDGHEHVRDVGRGGDSPHAQGRASGIDPDADVAADGTAVLDAVRAGASGYLLRDAELPDIVAAIHAAAPGRSTSGPGGRSPAALGKDERRRDAEPPVARRASALSA